MLVLSCPIAQRTPSIDRCAKLTRDLRAVMRPQRLQHLTATFVWLPVDRPRAFRGAVDCDISPLSSLCSMQ